MSSCLNFASKSSKKNKTKQNKKGVHLKISNFKEPFDTPQINPAKQSSIDNIAPFDSTQSSSLLVVLFLIHKPTHDMCVFFVSHLNKRVTCEFILIAFKFKKSFLHVCLFSLIPILRNNESSD